MSPRIFCFHPEGYHGHLVEIELEIRRGIPAMDVVGLAGSAVREARERLRPACSNSGYTIPPDRILFNLRPAGLAKEGTAYDLALAVALLVASAQLYFPHITTLLVLGELSLSGMICPVDGVLAALARAKEQGIQHAIIPHGNAGEAHLMATMALLCPGHLEDLAIAGPPETWQAAAVPAPRSLPLMTKRFEAMRGQRDYKLALMVAAAGEHHLLVCGPPGQGKTMGLLALPELWPELDLESFLESRRLFSLAGLLKSTTVLDFRPPFRMPHHSASAQAILGGGKPLRPGELSLAHRGILVLDEAPEFNQSALQGLREPLEAGTIALSRAGRSAWYPARATLCLSMNPCPCGNLGKAGAYCVCRPQDIGRYWARLGAPLLDRIDLRVSVAQNDGQVASQLGIPLDLAGARQRIKAARQAQFKRFGRGILNGQWTADKMPEGQFASKAAIKAAHDYATADGASWRSYVATLRLALSLADLAQHKTVELSHLEGAIELRSMAKMIPGMTLGQ